MCVRKRKLVSTGVESVQTPPRADLNNTEGPRDANWNVVRKLPSIIYYPVPAVYRCKPYYT